VFKGGLDLPSTKILTAKCGFICWMCKLDLNKSSEFSKRLTCFSPPSKSGFSEFIEIKISTTMTLFLEFIMMSKHSEEGHHD
jgi:hypothetical protein